MERQLRKQNPDVVISIAYNPGYFNSEIEKDSIPIRPRYEFPNMLAAPSASEIDELADKSEGLEQRVSSLKDSYETLKRREVELTEWRWVLTEAGSFFDRVVYIQSTPGP